MRLFIAVIGIAIVLINPVFAGDKDSTGMALVDNCDALARVGDINDPAEIAKLNKSSNLLKSMYCVGFLDSFSITLRKLRDFYKANFENTNLSDEQVVRLYLAITLLIAPNVCLPDNVTPKILARVLIKYGKDHPSKLSDGMYEFAGRAFAEAYVCPPFSQGAKKSN